MNGSSAYSNVLLTPAVAASSPPKSAAPTYDKAADDANSFRQSFDDARAQNQARLDSDKPGVNRKPAYADNKSDKIKNDDKQPLPAKRESKKAEQKNDAPLREKAAAEAKPLRAAKKTDPEKKATDLEGATPATAVVTPQQDPSPVSALLNKLLGNTEGKNSASDEALDSSETQSGELNLDAIANTQATATADQKAKITQPLTADAIKSSNTAGLNTELKPQSQTNPETDSAALANADQGAGTLATSSDLAMDTKPATNTDKPADELTALLETADTADQPMVAKLKSLLAETRAGKAATSAENPTGQAAEAAPGKSTVEKLFQTLAKSVTGDSGQAAGNSSDSLGSALDVSSPSSPASGFEALSRGLDSQSPATRGFVVQTAVPVPVGQPQWSEAVGEKVLWLAAQNVSAAEIHLHPKDLGPMQVNVTVNQDQANVTFTSHHAVVREVLDQNLNRLRDMFNEQGLNLVNVDVSDKSFQRQQGDGRQQQGRGDGQPASEEPAVSAVSLIKQDRLVDHYA